MSLRKTIRNLGGTFPHGSNKSLFYIFTCFLCDVCDRGHVIYLKAAQKFVQTRSQGTQYEMTRLYTVRKLTNTMNTAIHPKN